MLLKMTDNAHNSIYQEALEQALRELGESMAERDLLEERLDAADRRIFRLREGAMGIGALLGRYRLGEEFPDLFPDRIDPDKGLTDAVRDLLKSHHPYSHTPVQIRDGLKEKGYGISKHKNPLASIHTVLKRLVEKGEIREGNRDGRTVYIWTIKPDQKAGLSSLKSN